MELQDGPSADFDTNLFKEFDLGWRAAHMHSDSISVFFAGFSGADRRGSTDGGCRKPSALVPRDKELAHTGLQQTNMTI